jgi:tetratricopeptide (TPR) repeat protein
MSREQAAARMEEAKALQKAGEQRAAIAAYGKALELGAPPADVNLQLGVLYSGLGEREAAAEHLRRVLAEQPRHEDALCMLGTVMYDLGRFGDAVRHLEQALAVRPAFPEASFNLGLARFENGDLNGAAASITSCYLHNRGDLSRPLEQHEMGVNPTKLRHDSEQLEYLRGLGRLPAQFDAVLADYRALLAAFPANIDPSQVAQFDPARHPHVARTYKRPVYLDNTPPPAGPIINPALDFAAIEKAYKDSQPNVMAVDGLVTAEALAALRRFCRESTIWNNIKVGYLGAYFYDGFCSPLLLRLAHELRESFPGVIRGLPLQMMWGYKCDAALTALATHADAAAVNVNFWITEDDANLDPAGGGLLVHTCDAPADWGFNKYNYDAAAIERYLAEAGSQPLRIPYRANRAAIFDSDLFHASDSPRFREGYLNRRINITLLYGSRQ